MKTYKVPVYYQMVAILEVEAEDIDDASDKAGTEWEKEGEPFTQFPHHSFIPNSDEIGEPYID